ncbi:MAG: isoprenylcysteine carboxylmethyltransferase family protein [Gammaproteobacteria bacterium]|nr:isoprenylcysteine carboxylmethyltransferase family protein [Gammaproteobacteria bacterium]
MKTRIPPPLVTVIFMVIMWWLATQLNGFQLHFPGSAIVAILLGLSGLIVIVMGILTFRRHETTVNPLKPRTATRLVDSGIYGYTRNPMYLGNVIILIAWGVFLDNGLLLVSAVVFFVLFMNLFQIGPEEEALSDLFGEDYRAYQQKVRRWI